MALRGAGADVISAQRHARITQRWIRTYDPHSRGNGDVGRDNELPHRARSPSILHNRRAVATLPELQSLLPNSHLARGCASSLPVCTENQVLGTTADPRCGRPLGRLGWGAAGCGHRVLTSLSCRYVECLHPLHADQHEQRSRGHRERHQRGLGNVVHNAEEVYEESLLGDVDS